MQNDRPPGSRRPAPRGQAATGRRTPLSEQQTSVQPRRPRPGTPSRQAAPGRRPRRWTRIAGRILIATILLGLFGAGALAVTGYVLYQRSASALGDISALINQDYGGAKIYDRNGTLLYEFEDKDSGLHQHVPLSQISPWVVKATIAT
ncbi:MAG TPA: hypothetical protein VFA70_04135, partial [Dehalococcoidia bacterium]|nr:hypothetical protein [Dehalococcoidia bacterium]